MCCKKMVDIKILVLALISCYFPCIAYKPVVLIHGIMTGSGSMELISRRIQEKHPGTKVYNVNRFESWSSLETMWHQVLDIGNDIANISSQHPEGINLIGYSQGGLIARGIVQTFPNVSVSTFISLSSPQAGQYGAGFLHIVFPDLVKDTAYELFYSRVGQHTSVGNYWKDPYHQSLYEEYNVYLPYINNHLKSVQSENFKSNLLKLKRLVLIGGPDDQVITPWQSSQFGYYDNNNETVIEMKAQEIYTEDRIGLRALDQSKRLHVVTVPGVNHFNWHMNMRWATAKSTNPRVICLPPYHCELNPIELVWTQVKSYVAANNKSYKIDEVRTLFLQGVAKLDRQKWSSCVKHVITKIETKMYEVDNHVENMLEKFIIDVSAESSSEGRDDDSF